tara:strand:+ start:801 stop:1364 length:564 start_codon:yes stop_codon:yes gene_type:complete
MFKELRLKKYKWKCRIILLSTPHYKNKEYLEAKKIYQKNIKLFHKNYLKLITTKKKNKKFKISIIDFNGKSKKNFRKLNFKNILKTLGQNSEKIKDRKLKPTNLSLYSDYNPRTTTHGLGFKNKEKAIFTIKTIRKRELKYQVNVIATMLGRAKNHPNQTSGMREAIKIFTVWMKNYKKIRSTQTDN